MKVLTQRLELYPLKPDELMLLTQNLSEAEKKLGFTYKAEPLEGFFADIVKEQAKITAADAKNYIWHTFWLILRKSDRVCVGMTDFKDVPDKNLTAEIGYGTGSSFTGMGYMTEAVGGLCDWAAKQTELKFIIAETEADNIPSQSILKHWGFTEISRNKTVWWKKRL